MIKKLFVKLFKSIWLLVKSLYKAWIYPKKGTFIDDRCLRRAPSFREYLQKATGEEYTIEEAMFISDAYFRFGVRLVLAVIGIFLSVLIFGAICDVKFISYIWLLGYFLPWILLWYFGF